MSEFRKANTDNPYFLTLTVVGWADIFTRSIYCEMILDSFAHCQKHKGLELFTYVIMPSHLHFIARQSDNLLNAVIGNFKSYTAKAIVKEVESNRKESRRDWLLNLFQYHAHFKKQHEQYQFWQKTNMPIELSWPAIFDQKHHYILQNPVKANIVTEPEHFYYSSAHPEQRLELVME